MLNGICACKGLRRKLLKYSADLRRIELFLVELLQIGVDSSVV